MRAGYAIRSCGKNGGWLNARRRVDGVPCPVTIYVINDEDAMVFRSLKDARNMLKALRKESRTPERLHILDARWRVIV